MTIPQQRKVHNTRSMIGKSFESFGKSFKEELEVMLLTLFHKIPMGRALPNSCYSGELADASG